MALTIFQRPIGVIIDDAIDAIVTDGGGDALVSALSHGLADQQYVYVSTDVENYNGFFKIGFVDANSFRLYDEEGVTLVDYISNASGSIYPQLSTHGFSCAHLPITYKISNTLWPTNSADTVRTISTLNNDLGYARLTLSGALGTFEDLSFVKISGASNSDYDGVYQILDKLSTSNITLNVAYTSFTNSGLLGASIQLYYGNYNVVVRIYAGINSSHQWTAQKPYELAATLELIPDDNNEVFFSINEILKAYIETKNNLLLGTLPNNIDFWTQFYISIAESYDSSDGYTVGTTTTSFTSDQTTFEGYAVNAMLPFKNIYSGYLSEYLMTRNTAKFLTMFVIPVLFSCGEDTPDCYQDISFINPFDDAAITLKKEYYNNGTLQTTVNTSLGTIDSGVIRAEIEADCSYDRLEISLVLDSETLLLQFVDAIQESSASVDWVLNAVFLTPKVTLTSGQSSEEIGFSQVFHAGIEYTITPNLQRVSAGGTNNETVYVRFYTTFSLGSFSGLVHEYSSSYLALSSFSFTPSEDVNYIVFFVQRPAGAGSYEYTLINTTIGSIEISETKTFDIDCLCSSQEKRLTWLNPLGGFDYFAFKAETGYAVDITNTVETKKNIFPEWPKSYGEFSDTIRKQVSRESSNRLFFTSQYLTDDQANAMAYIKTSPLVQIINSKKDKRTIIVDADSFTIRTDNQKLITLSFNAVYTDNIGSQKV